LVVVAVVVFNSQQLQDRVVQEVVVQVNQVLMNVQLELQEQLIQVVGVVGHRMPLQVEQPEDQELLY
jgi:hypothetical protein